MRDNPMCRECCRLDAIDADPDLSCPVCGPPKVKLQAKGEQKSKLAIAVEIARGGPPHGPY
jgi:hypothetical protein